MAQLNSTSATANSLLAFQRSGSGLWRIGDAYNGGNNYFELHNTVLTNNAIQVLASSNEATFLSSKTYSTGNAIGIAVQHNLTIPNGVNVGLAAIGGVNSNLNLTLGGSTTVANTGRQGLEGSTSISFTGAGTLTMTQGSTIRAFSALSSVYAFNGSAVGTITHLAGLRICFPDNVGSAVNITNNYALLINNQTTGTGTVTYTNRWGIYQEGASDLNYFAGNSLFGTTTNVGAKISIAGYMYISNRPLAQIVFNSTGSYYGQIQNDAADKWSFARNTTNDGTLGTPIMTWDAATQNVGIGTTGPNNLLELSNLSTGGALRFSTSANTAFYWDIGRENVSTGDFLFRKANGGAAVDIMRIDNAGNLGLGVTPSAWAGTGVKAFQFQNGSLAASNTFGTLLSFNSIYDGNYKYLVNGSAGQYEIGSNEHRWKVAPSGTAGNAISFTQAMTLAANGNLLIGTTTDAGQKLQVNGTIYSQNTSGAYTLFLHDTTSSYSWGFIARGNANLYLREPGVNDQFIFYAGGNFEATNGSIKTAAPTTGTAAAWKLGSRVAATVVVNTTEYIEVDIGGTLYKLATVT
jgi:hypothetical protein